MNIVNKICLISNSRSVATDLLENFIGTTPTLIESETASNILRETLSISHVLANLLQSSENRSKTLRYFAGDIVSSLYRAALNRNPDQVGYEEYVHQLSTCVNLDEIISIFINSQEFRNKHLGIVPFMHQSMPAMTNDYDKASPEQLQAISDRIKKSWEHLGDTRAHHSVLTSKDFLPESLEKNIEVFWQSGENEVKEIKAILKRHLINPDEVKVAVEYGCGVGRVTTPLSKLVRDMHAYDISVPHLNYAKDHASKVGADIQFHLVNDPLAKLQPCDLFYSRIVFQHNPPPIIQQLIKNAIESLKPCGIAIFQVPTYIKDYSFQLEPWIKTDHALDMQMHCIPQKAVIKMALSGDCEILEIREDNWCGEPTRYLSNTFVLKKKDNRGLSIS